MNEKVVNIIDQVAKASITLIITSIVTNVVDTTYDKYVIERRNNKIPTE